MFVGPVGRPADPRECAQQPAWGMPLGYASPLSRSKPPTPNREGPSSPPRRERKGYFPVPVVSKFFSVEG